MSDIGNQPYLSNELLGMVKYSVQFDKNRYFRPGFLAKAGCAKAVGQK